MAGWLDGWSGRFCVQAGPRWGGWCGCACGGRVSSVRLGGDLRGSRPVLGTGVGLWWPVPSPAGDCACRRPGPGPSWLWRPRVGAAPCGRWPPRRRGRSCGACGVVCRGRSIGSGEFSAGSAEGTERGAPNGLSWQGSWCYPVEAGGRELLVVRKHAVAVFRRQRGGIFVGVHPQTTSATSLVPGPVALAGSGYDHDNYRLLVWDLSVMPLIARRGTERGSGLGKQRWAVERAFAHLY